MRVHHKPYETTFVSTNQTSQINDDLTIIDGYDESTSPSPTSHATTSVRAKSESLIETLLSFKEIKGNYIISCQEDLDELSGVTLLSGSLTIKGDQDLDLSPLIRLQRITGSLTITKASLTSCQSFRNLRYVDQTLMISDTKLTHMRGFEKLVSVSSIDIIACPNLTTIDSFYNLTKLEGLTISNNSRLTTISGFKKLTTLSYLEIEYNTSLLDIGFSCLTSIGDLSLQGQNLLTDIGGFLKVRQIEHLKIENCSQFSSFAGLESVSSISSLSLKNLNFLLDFSTLTSLHQCNTIEINQCNSLTSLHGFERLTKCTSITISDCEMFAHLSGVEHIKTIEEGIYLYNLPQLPDLKPLHNLEACNDLYFSQICLLQNFNGLKNLQKAYSIDVDNCINFENINGLNASIAVSYMNLKQLPNCIVNKNLKAISKKAKLTIQQCEQLHTFSLTYCM